MSLIRTSLLSGIAAVIKILTLLGLNKVLAVYVGPAGYAVIGQLQNAVQMMTTFASGAINVGVTRYTAEYHDNEQLQHKVWRTAGSISLLGSIISGVLIAVFSSQIAGWFVNDEGYAGVFLWFAAALVFFTLNALLLAVVNGKKEVGIYVLANIAGSIFSLLVTSALTLAFGLYGALVALAIYQSLSFVVTLALCFRLPWFKLGYFVGGIDKEIAGRLLKYTVMALTSALCVPISHMVVRNHLGHEFGWESAGYWEAMWRLSASYLMLVTTTLSVYYLPRLSELKLAGEIRAEIFRGYRVILPLAAVCGVIMYLLREWIVQLLFSSAFQPVEGLFVWQLVGDTLKIASWLLGYILTAKAFLGLFIVSEVLFSALFAVLVFSLSGRYGLEGAVIAHAITYAGHLVFMFVSLKAKKIL